MNIVDQWEKNDPLIPEEEIRTACETILASNLFAGAPRMCRLLRYLVEKAVSGDSRNVREYAIGIEVFDREPSAYSTTEDPTVRVQIGRLREKLKEYYAVSDNPADIEISIPLGRYMPTIRWRNAATMNTRNGHTLAIQQIKCIARCKDGEPFTQGLYEELMHQLFETFENSIVVYPLFTPRVASDTGTTAKTAPNSIARHLLEGSIRIDSERIRASIRLVDASLGCIAWSKQFDRNIFFAITLQEELASSICNEIKRFFRHS